LLLWIVLLPAPGVPQAADDLTTDLATGCGR